MGRSGNRTEVFVTHVNNEVVNYNEIVWIYYVLKRTSSSFHWKTAAVPQSLIIQTRFMCYE